ncbi:MAG: hypothetical protein DSY32_04155, partial [Aquifex sp.]
MLFDRYLLSRFLGIFLNVSLVSVFLVSLYALLDFLIGFKEKKPEVALSYFLNILPLGFYYISFITLSISLIIFLRKVFEKKIELTAESFGISPFRFSLPLLLFSLFLSFTFLLGNEYAFPKLLGNLWFIEKNYKKKQEVKGFIKNFWFVKKEKAFKTYYHVGNLNLSDGSLFNFYALKVERKSLNPAQILKVYSGVWRGKEIFIRNGEVYDFVKEKREKIFNRFFKLGLSVKEVELFSEKIDFLSLSELFFLAQKSKKVGLNADVYAGEFLYRVMFSLSPVFIFLFSLYFFF